jgi:NAD(P)H-dependent FMN reductase
MVIHVFEGLSELPLFNPDLETQAPQGVRDLRAAVTQADAILVASPEYAHGVTAVIKNALDWLVSFEPFVGKRVAVLNAAARAWHADAALREILHTMSADIVQQASVTIPVPVTAVTEAAMLQCPSVVASLKCSLEALRAES